MRLHIIHTNDLHSHLDEWPYLKQYILDKKAYYDSISEPYLILDAGDAMDGSHPLVEATNGKIMVDLFNEVGYNAVTIGNNEGLNFSPDQLSDNYALANYDCIIGNIKDQTTQTIPDWAKLYQYYNFDGFTVAVLGFTAAYSSYFSNGYIVEDAVERVEFLVREVKQKADFIIVLSHLGVDLDRYLASLYPEIQLIIGAHTHHFFKNGEWNNQSLLVATGKYGQHIGEVDLYYDRTLNTLHLTASTRTVKDLKRIYPAVEPGTYYRHQGHMALRRMTVGELPFAMNHTQLVGADSFAQLGLTALLAESNQTIGIINSGLFLSSLESGRVNYDQIHRALPHPIHLMVVTLTGYQLESLMNQLLTKSQTLVETYIQGHGFRGKQFGNIIYCGIEKLSTGKYSVNGKPLEKETIYKLATVDHLYYLPYFDCFEHVIEREIKFPRFIRNIVADYIYRHYPLKE